MTMSSMTRMARMTSVSSSASRRKSIRPLTVTALEETYTAAARMTAAKLSPKATRPTRRPTPAFSKKSIDPPRPRWRPLRSSLSNVNSSPRKKRRKMIPSSATNVVTSEGSMTLRARGSFGPSRRPASR
jgi:hypothetical protein